MIKIYESNDIFFREMPGSEKKYGKPDVGIITQSNEFKSYVGLYKKETLKTHCVYEAFVHLEGSGYDVYNIYSDVEKRLNNGDVVLGTFYKTKNGKASAIMAAKYGFKTVSEGKYSKIMKCEVTNGSPSR